MGNKRKRRFTRSIRLSYSGLTTADRIRTCNLALTMEVTVFFSTIRSKQAREHARSDIGRTYTSLSFSQEVADLYHHEHSKLDQGTSTDGVLFPRSNRFRFTTGRPIFVQSAQDVKGYFWIGQTLAARGMHTAARRTGLRLATGLRTTGCTFAFASNLAAMHGRIRIRTPAWL